MATRLTDHFVNRSAEPSPVMNRRRRQGREVLCPPTARVLLIEGDPDDARMVADSLHGVEEVDFHCRNASTLDEVLQILDGDEVDVVVLDLCLPDTGVLGGLRRLVASAPGLPLVVLTGNPEEHLAISAIRLGADDFVEKADVSARTLGRAIRYACERKQTERGEAFLSDAALLLGWSRDLD